MGLVGSSLYGVTYNAPVVLAERSSASVPMAPDSEEPFTVFQSTMGHYPSSRFESSGKNLYGTTNPGGDLLAAGHLLDMED